MIENTLTRAMGGVGVVNRNRVEDLMQRLGLTEATDQLAVENSVYLY